MRHCRQPGNNSESHKLSGQILVHAVTVQVDFKFPITRLVRTQERKLEQRPVSEVGIHRIVHVTKVSHDIESLFPLCQIPQKIRAIVRLADPARRASITEVLLMNPTTVSTWSAAWMWSLPLIVATVVFHSIGLGLIDHGVSVLLNGSGKNRVPFLLSMSVIGGSALCATILHGIEGLLWAVAYLLLGAVSGRQSAVLYSLNAITSYGHTDLDLKGHWQLMGALEALNGWIVFGLTTAFLFTVIQKVWPRIHRSTERNAGLS